MFAIFRHFRRLVDAVIRLVDVIQRLVEVQHAAGPVLDRLDALELSRHKFEAEVQGTLLEAKGKLKGALSSEARERHMSKQNEKDASPFPVDGAEITEDGSVILPNDVEAGEAERVSSLRLDVAPSPKAAAIAAKWAS